jgi:hypothetical protein
MPKRTRCFVRPSLPTTSPTRSSSCVGDLAGDAVLVAFHPGGKIAGAHGLQGMEQFEEVDG